MSAEYIQEGATITYANAGETDISYKDVIDLGTRIAVAAADIAAGDSGSISTVGVFELPAVNDAAFVQGEEVFWDGTELTSTPGDLTRAGWCVEAKAETATTARVKID
jgi:predicted RecA/RadA family phage recombinase